MQRALFGGALSCELPPPGPWVDASDFRPSIPDNQEVFVVDDSETSFIVEIVERADVDDDAALKFYFADLADQTGADLVNSSIDHERQPLKLPFCSNASYSACLSGVQRTPHGASRVTLGLIRLLLHKTDILLTFSAPYDVTASSSVDDDAFVPVLGALLSFRVLDETLFGDSGQGSAA